MSKCNEIAEVLKRNGLHQSMRYDRALDPGNIKLMGFGLEDWMKFARKFAKDVNFFAETDDQAPDGNWEALFPDYAAIKQLLDELESTDKLTPHLTLFVCFLQLIGQSTNRLNAFAKRHLDFYYSEVLQLQHLPEAPDSVNLIFDLARNFVQEKIDAGTEFDAGKDLTGKKLVFKLAEDFVLNQALVTSVKSVYNAPDSPVNGTYAIKAAVAANTYDGAGGAFPGNDTSWYPFGYAGTPDLRPEQGNARLGFAVASPTLALSEGARQVVVQSLFASAPAALSPADLIAAISVYYTGPKGWTGPLPLSPNTFSIDENTGALQDYTTGLSGKMLSLLTEFEPGLDPVVGYSAKVHGGHFTTADPIIRFEVDTRTLAGYNVYKQFSRPVSTVRLKVNVTGMRSLLLESDTGILNAKKPFYPFTTNPVKGSVFSVYHEEIFQKKWKHIAVSMHWKNTPDSFSEHYKAYDKIFLGNVSHGWIVQIQSNANAKKPKQPDSGNTSLDSLSDNVDEEEPEDAGGLDTLSDNVDEEEPEDAGGLDTLSDNVDEEEPEDEGGLDSVTANGTGYDDLYDSIVTGSAYFRADKSVYTNGEWGPSINLEVILFVQQDSLNPGEIEFGTSFSFDNNGYPAGNSGPVRLRLEQSFLQELYPLIYSLAIVSDNQNVLIPNQPYIPFADDIRVDYTATDEADLKAADQQTYNDRSLQLFHLHPFGEAEENVYEKQRFDPQLQTCSLTPVYCKGGELFIGLENAAALQQVSLLIQVLEGSENPQADSFVGKQKVHWDILCNNYWKQLDSKLMQVNTTDNFLQSGLVKFKVPAQATSDNTLLPPGLFWVRAKTYKTYDAVCRVLGIEAQAATAVFDNRGNELSHLEKGIPAETISKLVNRIAEVKSVKQPFSSFGGRPAENDTQYYRRVSERLRHKNRAIALWDYEHLVLQQFPEIYKIKCLPHTCDCSFQSPGSVTLVVIPDTVNGNVFDRYQPRVSKATLNRIEHFISGLNSLHVKTHVINPDYEEVKVSLKVKFYPQFDEALYIDKLNEDITRLLSPWAFSGREEIRFGVMLHLSVLIDYVEKLGYVDYLQDVMLLKGGKSTKNAEPSSPKAILVSARRHEITTGILSCSTTNSATEQCQL